MSILIPQSMYRQADDEQRGKANRVASSYLSASEVAEELGISLPTLYSYVSRGLLRSEFADPGKRTRRYHAEDVQRLKARQEMRRDPQKVVDTALHWGTPMLPSALTLIEAGRFYYRGQDVLDLARDRSVEQVAALLWTGEAQTGRCPLCASRFLPCRRTSRPLPLCCVRSRRWSAARRSCPFWRRRIWRPTIFDRNRWPSRARVSCGV